LSGIDFHSFYVPMINFMVFGILFFLAFRSLFRGMAKAQKEEFLQAKLEAQAEKKAAENMLNEVLFEERELAKKLHAIKEQAVVDNQSRAEQLIKDAEFHAAHILEESKRLIDAEYERARQKLQKELLSQLEACIADQAPKFLTAKKKQSYTAAQLSVLQQCASPSQPKES